MQVFCGFNLHGGQLGYGYDQHVGDGKGPSVAEAGAVPISTVSAFEMGDSSTCAISSGQVKCWGSNDQGSLGYYDFTPRGVTPDTTPDKLPGIALGEGFVPAGVLPGYASTCAWSTQGLVKCWGSFTNGYPGLQGVGVPNEVTIANAPLMLTAQWVQGARRRWVGGA